VCLPIHLSVPWLSCLGCRHAGCLQLSLCRPPEMCRLNPSTDGRRSAMISASNCHQRHIILPPTCHALFVIGHKEIFTTTPLRLTDPYYIIMRSRFFDFPDGGRPPSWIFKIEIFNNHALQRQGFAPVCQILHSVRCGRLLLSPVFCISLSVCWTHG